MKPKDPAVVNKSVSTDIDKPSEETVNGVVPSSKMLNVLSEDNAPPPVRPSPERTDLPSRRVLTEATLIYLLSIVPEEFKGQIPSALPM